LRLISYISEYVRQGGVVRTPEKIANPLVRQILNLNRGIAQAIDIDFATDHDCKNRGRQIILSLAGATE
jgi:hypothetical protein